MYSFQDFGSRWQQVIDKSISRVRIQSDNMEQVRRDTGSTAIGPIPHSMNSRVLKGLSQSFTHRDNPNWNKNPNITFQRDLDELPRQSILTSAMLLGSGFTSSQSDTGRDQRKDCNRDNHKREDC